MRKSFLRLLAKGILFVAVFFVIDFFIGIFFKRLNNYAFKKNEYSRMLNYQYCIENAKPDIAIIGSSTASHHYIPLVMEDSLHMSVYNFGKDGSFFLYQNALINLMLERYSPQYLIWEIGEGALSTVYDNHFEYQNLGYLYPWYSNPYLKQMVDKKDRYQKYRMLLNAYRNNSQLLKSLTLCIFDMNDPLKGYVPLENTSISPVKKTQNPDDYILVPEKVEMLVHTIERCQNAGVRIVFTSSPRLFDESIKESESYLTLRYIASYYDIPFIDYYCEEPFISEASLFRDNAHLNDEGTHLYMTKFIHLLHLAMINNEDN